MMHFTLEQLQALPEMEGFGRETRIIDGKTVEVPVMPRQPVAFYVDDTTPMQWLESDGADGAVVWRLGQYADGTWFKRRA